jgi:hypothetical protein
VTDAAYPLGTGSRWNNGELRYSLRSIEQNIPNVGNVFIATSTLPSFLNRQTVIHIDRKDNTGRVTTNTFAKALAICRHKDCGEQVLWMNDDILILQPYDVTRYHSRAMYFSAGEYGKAMRATVDILNAHGIADPVNFETHRPVLLQRGRFLELMQTFENRKGPLAWVSLYLNLIRVTATPSYDVKVHDQFSEALSTLPVLSTSHGIVKKPEVQKAIDSRFPHPSRFERA